MGPVRCYMLPQEADTFSIQIFDEQGELVRQDSLPTAGQGAGTGMDITTQANHRCPVVTKSQWRH